MVNLKNVNFQAKIFLEGKYLKTILIIENNIKFSFRYSKFLTDSIKSFQFKNNEIISKLE